MHARGQVRTTATSRKVMLPSTGSGHEENTLPRPILGWAVILGDRIPEGRGGGGEGIWSLSTAWSIIMQHVGAR